MEIKCASCGATGDFWAWYDAPERQSIDITVDEDGKLHYDYTGNTTSGDAPGDDTGYMCGACSAFDETLEGLLGLPVPKQTPPSNETLDAILAILNRPGQWSPDTLEDIAATLTNAGFELLDNAEPTEREHCACGRELYADGHCPDGGAFCG